jgi:hypothetical protein
MFWLLGNNYLCIKAKKLHLLRMSLSFLAEAQPRLENSQERRHSLAEVHINFLGDRTTYKTKDIIGKITNLFYSI